MRVTGHVPGRRSEPGGAGRHRRQAYRLLHPPRPGARARARERRAPARQPDRGPAALLGGDARRLPPRRRAGRRALRPRAAARRARGAGAARRARARAARAQDGRARDVRAPDPLSGRRPRGEARGPGARATRARRAGGLRRRGRRRRCGRPARDGAPRRRGRDLPDLCGCVRVLDRGRRRDAERRAAHLALRAGRARGGCRRRVPRRLGLDAARFRGRGRGHGHRRRRHAPGGRRRRFVPVLAGAGRRARAPPAAVSRRRRRRAGRGPCGRARRGLRRPASQSRQRGAHARGADPRSPRLRCGRRAGTARRHAAGRLAGDARPPRRLLGRARRASRWTRGPSARAGAGSCAWAARAVPAGNRWSRRSASPAPPGPTVTHSRYAAETASYCPNSAARRRSSSFPRARRSTGRGIPPRLPSAKLRLGSPGSSHCFQAPHTSVDRKPRTRDAPSQTKITSVFSRTASSRPPRPARAGACAERWDASRTRPSSIGSSRSVSASCRNCRCSSTSA